MPREICGRVPRWIYGSRLVSSRAHEYLPTKYLRTREERWRRSRSGLSLSPYRADFLSHHKIWIPTALLDVARKIMRG